MFWLYCSLSVLPRNATEEDLDEGPEGVEEGFFERKIEDDSSSDEDEEVAPVDERWYKKAAYIVNHVNRISKSFVFGLPLPWQLMKCSRSSKEGAFKLFASRKSPLKRATNSGPSATPAMASSGTLLPRRMSVDKLRMAGRLLRVP